MEKPQPNDHGDIQQYGRGGIHPEFIERIQYAAQQRSKAYQREIGQGDARQQHREGKLLRRRVLARETARQQPGDGVGRSNQDDSEKNKHRQQDGKRTFGEMIAVRDTARPRRLAVEHRNEGCGKSALRKQGAKHVGQAKSYAIESVRRKACTDIARGQ